MSKSLRLGIYLHDLYKKNEKITWANSDSINFIRKLNIAKTITLSVAVKHSSEAEIKKSAIIIEDSGIRLLPLPGWESIISTALSLPKHLKTILRCARELSNSSDLIWLRTPSVVAPFFYYFARRRKIPVILHIPGNILKTARRGKFGGIKLVIAKLMGWLIHFSTRWMSRGSLVFVTGCELHNLFTSSLHIAHLLDDIRITQKDLVLPKKTHGLARKLLFVGQLAQGKGVDLLLKVFTNLTVEFPNLQLFIAGSGPLLDEVKYTVKRLNMEKNVNVLGFVPPNGTLKKLYRGCDIFVQPSDFYGEGFPRVILEAWASGLPVVATKLGGVPYRVSHGLNGLLASPGDEEELREMLRKAIINPDLRYRLALGGLKKVASLTFENQAKVVKDLIVKYFPFLKLSRTQ